MKLTLLLAAIVATQAGRSEREMYRDGALRLAEMGLAVLLYDKRGVGQSTGQTLLALDGLPAKASGVLTLVRFAEADHGMYRSEGSRVNDWETIESWLRKRFILARGSAGTR